MSKETKTSLINRVYENSDNDLRVVRDVVSCFLSELSEVLAHGNSVEIRGFGVFKVRERAARANHRNPKTGELVFVPSKKTVVFSPGNSLKERLSSVKQDD